MWALESCYSFLISLALVAWNGRKILLFILAAASLTGNIIALLASNEWDASTASHSLRHLFLPLYYYLFTQLWSSLVFLSQPLCLYFLLNLILMSIVVKSGVLSFSHEEESPMLLSKLHHLGASKTSPDEVDTTTSRDPIRKKQDVALCLLNWRWSSSDQKRDQSFLTIETLEVHQPLVSQSTSHDLGEQKKISSAYASVNPLLSMPVGDTEMEAQTAAPVNFHLPQVEDPLRDLEKQAFLDRQGNDAGGGSDEQIVEAIDIQENTITPEEMSGEELFHRAEAFILKVQASWRLQSIQSSDFAVS